MESKLTQEEHQQIVKRKQLIDDFKTMADPLIQFLNDNFNPHATIIIDCNSAEVLTGEIAYHNKEFIKD
jgi:hypothetical protein